MHEMGIALQIIDIATASIPPNLEAVRTVSYTHLTLPTTPYV